jgi:DNA-binding response OmpR family regulator
MKERAYTVLVVDDDVALLQTLTDGLELLGNFRVEQAVNGDDGLERFYEVRPDCVIIDVKMPGLNGYQLVRALRGDPDSAATPLIMLTALAEEKQAFAGLAGGADQYLVKPTMPSALVAAVQRAIAVSEQDRQRQMQTLLEQSADEEDAGAERAPQAAEGRQTPRFTL